MSGGNSSRSRNTTGGLTGPRAGLAGGAGRTGRASRGAVVGPAQEERQAHAERGRGCRSDSHDRRRYKRPQSQTPVFRPLSRLFHRTVTWASHRGHETAAALADSYSAGAKPRSRIPDSTSAITVSITFTRAQRLESPSTSCQRAELVVGSLEHVLDGLLVGRALLAVAPVLVGQLPLLERVLLAPLEALAAAPRRRCASRT